MNTINAAQFRDMIRRTLLEEVEKRQKNINLCRVPEMNANGIDPTKKPKTFGTDSNSRDVASKEALVTDLKKLTMGIDPEITVIWDDHDDLMVNSRDLKFIRISPRWEDSYVIEMMNRNEDRIWVTGQSWEQVKEFVKVNLKDDNKYPTAVEKAYDKSYRNRKDETPSPDKGLPQKDKPDTMPLTTEPPKTSKSKDKNYTEKAKDDDDDSPNQPMREVGSFKRQEEHKSRSPISLRKEKTKFPSKKPNTTLTVKP
jgi:hypothetical protein